MTRVIDGAVVAKAPAKINLMLRVGSPDSSGYHPLVTVFQAIDLWDQVTVSPSSTDELVVTGTTDVSGVPTDQGNIVWRAVEAIASRVGTRQPLRIELHKSIPVAGGMAGGSADAAATLVAVNELWGAGATRAELHTMASEVGADVPFSLLGGLAVGLGRGDHLTPVERHRELHVVIVKSAIELSTPTVYRTLDEQRSGLDDALPHPDELGLDRVGSLAVPDLVDVMANDLQAVAIALAPAVQDQLVAVEHAGALRAMVSGSGPTVWGLCQSATHAAEVARVLTGQGRDAIATVATAFGAHLVTSSSPPTGDH